jgi:thiol-disulfide isomerase/thioredoxin
MAVDTEAGRERPRCLRAARRVLLFGLVGVVALAASGLTTSRSPAHRKPRLTGAPAFSVPGLSPGAPALDSRNLAGRVTVLTFWASWCVPCRSELPRLVNDLSKRNVALVGVDTNDSRSEAMRFLANRKLQFPSGFDDEGRVAEAFRLYGLPSTVVLTASGLVAAHYLGPVSSATLGSAIRQASAA